MPERSSIVSPFYERFLFNFEGLTLNRCLHGGRLGTMRPFDGDADLEAWPASVERFLELDFDTVIPGHGAAGGRELIEHTLAVLKRP